MRADWDYSAIEARLLSKIEKVESGCWEWRGSMRDKRRGYGQTKIAQKNYSVHRVSYEIFCGEIAEGLCVCHKCDNPSCINPEHLFLGTHQENVADQVAKDRHARADANGRAKLTEDTVLAIRSASGLRQREIADLYGISRQQVSNIRTGKHWPRVQVNPNHLNG